MFNIDYITILPGCHYTKNLTENHPYRFNNDLAEGFFGKNMNEEFGGCELKVNHTLKNISKCKSNES